MLIAAEKRYSLVVSHNVFFSDLASLCSCSTSKFSSNSQERKYRGRMKVPGCVLDIEDVSSAD